MCDVIMNNDLLLPASKSKKWRMGNKKSILPGIKGRVSASNRQIILSKIFCGHGVTILKGP